MTAPSELMAKIKAFVSEELKGSLCLELHRVDMLAHPPAINVILLARRPGPFVRETCMLEDGIRRLVGEVSLDAQMLTVVNVSVEPAT